MGWIQKKNTPCKIACHDYRQVSCSIALSWYTVLASRCWRNDSTTQVLIITWHSFLIPEMENLGRRVPLPNIKLTGYVSTSSSIKRAVILRHCVYCIRSPAIFVKENDELSWHPPWPRKVHRCWHLWGFKYLVYVQILMCFER